MRCHTIGKDTFWKGLPNFNQESKFNRVFCIVDGRRQEFRDSVGQNYNVLLQEN